MAQNSRNADPGSTRIDLSGPVQDPTLPRSSDAAADSDVLSRNPPRGLARQKGDGVRHLDGSSDPIESGHPCCDRTIAFWQQLRVRETRGVSVNRDVARAEFPRQYA